MAIYNENISRWTKQVEELQLKIEEERRKKTKIKTSRLAPINEKLVQEANIDLQYVEAAYVLY